MSSETLEPGEWGPFEELSAASAEIFRLRALLTRAGIDADDPRSIPTGHLVFRPDAADDERGRAHKAALVEYGDQSAEIDELIAPLLLEVWKAGIRTVHSCQDNPKGYVWIELASADDATRFVDVALESEPRDASRPFSLRNRALRQGPAGFWPVSRGLWLYKVLIEEPAASGPIQSKLLVSVRFPHQDLPAVVESLRQHNASG